VRLLFLGISSARRPPRRSSRSRAGRAHRIAWTAVRLYRPARWM